MESSREESYVQRYASIVDPINARYGPKQKGPGYTLVLVVAGIILCLVKNSGDLVSSFFLFVLLALVYVIVRETLTFINASGYNVKRVRLLAKSIIILEKDEGPFIDDSRQGIINAILHDEYPWVKYRLLDKPDCFNTVAGAFGMHLDKNESCFYGKANGMDFKCCECKMSRDGYGTISFFKGYIWAIDMGMSLSQEVQVYTTQYIHSVNQRMYATENEVLDPSTPLSFAYNVDAKPFKLPSEAWLAASEMANEVGGKLLMAVEGNTLYVAIHTGKETLGWSGGVIDNGILEQTARNLRLVATLPERIHLEAFKKPI